MALIVAANLYTYKNNTDKTSDIEPLEVQEDYGYGDIVIEEDPRLYSNVKVKNIDKVLEYIDPSEMQNYSDLLTLYSLFIPKINTEYPEEFFELNQDMIKNILGIYKKEKFNELINLVKQSGVNNESIVNHIELKEIKQEGNVLKSDISIHYDNATLNLSHYINYVFIEGQSYLYIYM